MTVLSTSGAIRRLTCTRSPKRARSSSRYRSMQRSSSASVVKSPWRRKEYLVKSANSTTSSRARCGSVLMNDAMALSEL